MLLTGDSRDFTLIGFYSGCRASNNNIASGLGKAPLIRVARFKGSV